MSIPPASSGRNKPRAYTSPPPDWLTSGKPGPEPPPAELPDWLKFQPPAGTTPPAEPPGWLVKAIAGAEPAPSIPSPQMEDSLAALRPAPLDAGLGELPAQPDEPPAHPAPAKHATHTPLTGDDDLFAALRADTAQAPVAGPPDWLTQKPAAEQPAEDSAAPPDRTASPAFEEKPAGEPAERPDWMTGLDTPAEPAPAEPAALPDWMTSADEAKPAEETPAALDWITSADEAKPAEETPSTLDWMTSADEVEPAEEAPALPDWMTSADEAKPAEETPAALDWITSADEAKPAEETPSALDWMTSADQVEPAEEAPALPDWMAAADEVKPAEEAPSVPDWMAAADAAKPGEEPTSLPDWLSDTGIPPAESAQPPKVPGKSGLLGRLSTGALPPSPGPADTGKTEPATQAAASGTGGMGESPDWLDALSKDDSELTPAAPPPDWLGQTPSTPTEASSLTLPPAPPTKTPDWLEELAKEESAELPPVPASVSASDAPDWLDQVMKDDTAPAAPAAPAESSDWLDQLAKAEPAAEATPPAEPVPPAAPTETPDWLDQLAKAEPAAEATPPAEPAPPAAPIETPDWLDQLAKAEPAAVATPPAEPASPAAPTETPDWPEAAPAAETPAEPPAPPADLASIDIPGAPPAAPVEPAPSSDDLADLLSGMDLGVPTAGADAGEDLLGMSGDLAPSPAARPEPGEAEAGLPDDLPEWLRTMQAAPDRPGKPAVTEAPLPAEALGDIEDLRFDKLVGEAEAPQPGAAEKVGALKDVVGAIRPELIFDAQTLKGGHLAAEMTLTKEQSQRIELLEDLLSHKTEEVVISGPRRRTLPIVRWLVAALLIAAVAAPIILKFTLLTAPSPASSGPADARDMLNSLSGESKIVVAFDYEPDTSAEMDQLALAILGKIAGQTGASVYAVSTRATGPALAQRAIEKTLAGADQAQHDRWLNLGYIPGGPNGITTLVVGSPMGLPSALSLNALGQSSGVAELSLTELDPTLIIVLTSSAEDLRAWVEQAGRPTGIPMIAATSVGNMPMATPYRQSKQVSALLSGVNDAVALRSMTGQEPDPAALSIWNTQATGALVATLLIVVGGAIYGLAALRNHQEQAS